MLESLGRVIDSLDRKPYGMLKRLKGRYEFDLFVLEILYIQGDPFAEPTRMRISVDLKEAGFDSSWYSGKSRSLGFREWLAQNFYRHCQKVSRSCGSGKSGLITIDSPAQQVLNRSCVTINGNRLEVIFHVGLAADGRRILARENKQIVCEHLPAIAQSCLVAGSLDTSALVRAAETNEDADAMRSQMKSKGLIGFVANGAKLARESGISDLPMTDGHPFHSPDSLTVTLDRPNAGPVTGMAIKKGVTLIVGGGYHGKSTLLKALEKGVYNHRPGDGREWVLCDEDAVKIRAEDGRAVSGIDISPFISGLPFGAATDHFSTRNASGSTSQAAGIMEALELGAQALLLDEDTCATNFMIRDMRMQQLIAKSAEPITPFVDRVGELFSERGVSSVLVMGGSGDYFDHCDLVIGMKNYQPSDLTEEAKKIAQSKPTGRQREAANTFVDAPVRGAPHSWLKGSKGKRPVHVKVHRGQEIEIGNHSIDGRYLEQIMHDSQLRAIGYALLTVTDDKNLLDWCRKVMDFSRNPLDLIDEPLGNLAGFRIYELVGVMNRVFR